MISVNYKQFIEIITEQVNTNIINMLIIFTSTYTTDIVTEF